MRAVVLTKILAAAQANNVTVSQAGVANTPLSINGSATASGVATFDTQRRVIVTSVGSDSGVTFNIFGTREGGIPIREGLVGAVGTVAQSNLDFLTVTGIVPTAATAGAVTVGTTTVGSSPYQLPNMYLTPFNIDVGVTVSGTVNFTVEYTYDDFYTVQPGGVVSVPTAFSLTALAAKTANTDGAFTSPVRGWRLTVNSGSGTATATGIQAGITN